MSQRDLPTVDGNPIREINATSGNETFALPASFAPGRKFFVRRSDSSANTVTISAAAGQTLNGTVAGSLTVAADSQAEFYCAEIGAWESYVSGGGSGGGASTVVSKTTTYTAAAGEFVRADATTAGFTVTLPASPTAGQQVGIVKTDVSANVVTVVAAGKTINGDANATIVSQWAGGVFEYDGSNWFLASVTAIAATSDPGAAQKASNLSDLASVSTARTNLGLGTAALISSTAGGDLSGTLPSPTVAKVNGVTISGTPTSGQVPTASSGSAAAWATAATVTFGTSSGTATEGNDSRVTGAAQKASNLSDLASASTARTNLGLGTAATAATGTTSGTVPLLSTGGVLPVARLATGTPDGTKFVRDDGTLVTPSGGSSSGPPFPVSPAFLTGVYGISATMSANRAMFMVNVGAALSVTRIGLVVTNSSGNIDVGIYSPTGTVGEGLPTTRKVSTGSTPCPAVGYAEFTVASTAINGGDWFAAALDNGTAILAVGANGSGTNNLFKGWMCYQASAFPLPATTTTPTVGLNGNGNVYMKGLV